MTESSEQNGLHRRKILGWMGLGLFGAFAVQSFPFKFLSGRVSKKASRKDKVKVSLNEMAVKRNRRVK